MGRRDARVQVHRIKHGELVFLITSISDVGLEAQSYIKPTADNSRSFTLTRDGRTDYWDTLFPEIRKAKDLERERKAHEKELERKRKQQREKLQALSFDAMDFSFVRDTNLKTRPTKATLEELA